jgi:hypothetical protein
MYIGSGFALAMTPNGSLSQNWFVLSGSDLFGEDLSHALFMIGESVLTGTSPTEIILPYRSKRTEIME